MIPERDYPPTDRPSAKKGFPKLPLLIAVVAAIGVGVWYANHQKTTPEMPPEVVVDPVKPAPQPFPEVVESAPDIPAIAEEELTEMVPAPELPPLAESDEFARSLLSSLSSDTEFSLWLQTDNLLQKAVTFIDGLSRGNILRKIIPVQPPQGKFMVVRDDDRILIDAANFQRYDALVSVFTSISAQSMVSIFHTLRPLLETAFSELGYPGDKVDNSVIAAIDQIVATPDVSYPIALKSESVAYQYADPALEALPAVQKQLLRMGPDNSAKIKNHLKEIRQQLLVEPQEQD